jgi:hypothetical protein
MLNGGFERWQVVCRAMGALVDWRAWGRRRLLLRLLLLLWWEDAFR